jgi:hypothetical protein
MVAPLPSPISEDYVETPTDITSSQLSRLSFNGEDMEMDVPRTGRARSGAITAEKKKFVVGYRDDCDKCRAKVPGHWAHFLPIWHPMCVARWTDMSILIISSIAEDANNVDAGVR